MTDYIADMNDPDIESYASEAQGIPDPGDLFSGISGRISHLPTNILQFLRKDESQLHEDKPFFHHRFVLIACLKERGGLVVDGSLFNLEPGHMILIFPYQSHYFLRFSNPSAMRWVFTTFEYRAAEELELLRNKALNLSRSGLHNLRSITWQLYPGSTEPGPDRRDEAPFSLGLLLAGSIRRAILTQPAAVPALQQKGGRLSFVNKAALHIQKNLSRHISIAEIAGLTGMSAGRLRCRFKQALGISLGAYIREARLHKACELLHNSESSIAQIADACGYDCQFAFSRAFRKLTGFSPRLYRKPPPPA